MVARSLIVTSLLLLFGLSQARAELRYSSAETDTGITFVVVSGEFDFADDLSRFAAKVDSVDAIAVTFDSPGGNVTKAMELGRIIRALGLATIQPRDSECSSACALAFLGGTMRFAQPGSIGVHRSSFAGAGSLDVDDAVAGIQQMTAMVMAYIAEMGADPALLGVALQYDSSDMRYLSASEMTQYRITKENFDLSDLPVRQAARPSLSSTPKPLDVDLSIPEARSGIVRHPRGSVELKAAPDDKAVALRQLRNGTRVTLSGSTNRWFVADVQGSRGYLHETWIKVNEYEGPSGSERFIQIKSVRTLDEGVALASSSATPLDIHLASNGWFAVTLRGTYALDRASDRLKADKASGSVPADSFITLGNTYVRRLCCN
ncbi:hypothetical protein FE840_020755 (plasmid) [Peteryoungia desertarenae]|uniref:SH3b domain-containing protein n=1 Tax=Peteryoungia desertarenae TaxID=1813451 RepID=A0ABX6QUQ0_9HYPH|nr:hypothetical protein FE840_020755 [Peteryoungia desertarenae]